MLSDYQFANAVRALSIDAIQKSRSGHPGMPMGMADIATVLWQEFLQHNPSSPDWFNRDRFILSNGHGSMLHYALLHLSGYDVTLDDIKQFRQLHSKTPGHPEYGYTPGVETTTGPLGQGIANGVGMALAEKILASRFNRENFPVIDHFTYVFMGDGCLMEGISHEVCSLAGTLSLGKLIAFWDDNNISIDGNVEGWFTDNTAERFRAYGWHVITNVDGHNPEDIRTAIEQAQAETQQPTLICCKTTIGFGSPNKAGKSSSHGSPLGEEEVALTRKALEWSYGNFEIPEEYYQAWDAKEKGARLQQTWQELFDHYGAAYPELAATLHRTLAGELPNNFAQLAAQFIGETAEKSETIASRKASQNCIEFFAQHLPELLGGSADLAGSNLTKWSGSKPVTELDADGNYIYYGVREFGMAAIMNGLALYGGFIPYGGTFLVFSDYARNAIRMSALMKQRVIYVMTHDSIGLGEDGPTHQPVEHVASLRLIPNLAVWRPCDAVETAVAWEMALSSQMQPSVLCLSRQTLPCQSYNPVLLGNIKRGGYILIDSELPPELIIIVTGSEVELAVQATRELSKQGKAVRVVSMPCAELFDAQDACYREQVLPPAITCRMAVEAGSTDYWYKYVGLGGVVIGMDTFGESAPVNQLFEQFGFTVAHLLEQARVLITKT